MLTPTLWAVGSKNVMLTDRATTAILAIFPSLVVLADLTTAAILATCTPLAVRALLVDALLADALHRVWHRRRFDFHGDRAMANSRI